ncbi:hypothetical protein HY484_02230 [Candidatus Woesearchaeota archaeon]|nr:hypothetical protein [Candidatus Woesearchaeota archaeon]
MSELKKGLEYVVLTSDSGGDEHADGNLEEVRKGSISVLRLTAEYINKTPQIAAWLNTGDIDDLYLAGMAATKDGKFNLKEFLQGNAALYAAMNEVYKQCRLSREQKLVVLGNQDVPGTFLSNVEDCTLVGADIETIAAIIQQQTQGKAHIKPAVQPLAQIGEIPVIGAMNTVECPRSIPQEDAPFIIPQCGFGPKFYEQYAQVYAEILQGKYYLMSHKGLIDKRDAFRKQEDTIHKIATNSLASFEAHWHEICANKVGETYRFRSGTNHFLIIGLDKESGKPADIKAVPFL